MGIFLNLFMKTLQKILLSLSIVCTYKVTYGQDSLKETYIKPNAISFSYLGTSALFGGTYERLIEQKYSLEFGVGLFGVGMGLTYLPPKLNFGRFHPYYGIKQVRFAVPTGFDSYVAYIPLGLNLVTKRNFQYSIDVGPCYWREYNVPRFTDNYRPHRLFVFGNFKIGYRF
jgi:hypothetical protein